MVAAFNANRLDDFVATFADSAVLTEFPSGRVLAGGRAALRAMFEPTLRDKKPGVVVRVDPRLIHGNVVIDYENVEETPRPAGGPRHAVWMYEITGGVIRRAWVVRPRGGA